MRITNNMLTRHYTNNLNDNLTKLTNYQSQLSSFKRITKLSDDPIGSLKSMRINTKIYKTEQYQEVVGTAKTVLTDAQSALDDINGLLANAYEKAVQASNSYLTIDEKNSIAQYVGQLRDQVVSIANSTSGEQYIFGGYNTQKEPFSVVAGKLMYNGLDISDDTDPDLIAQSQQAVSYEIGRDLNMEVTTPGTSVMSMGDNNLYAVLDGFYNALVGDAPASELSTYIKSLQSAQSNILAQEAQVGGKINRLELVANRYANDALDFASVKSEVEDVDVAEVTLQYQNAMQVYEAALAVGSKIIMPTLVDYLT